MASFFLTDRSRGLRARSVFQSSKQKSASTPAPDRRFRARMGRRHYSMGDASDLLVHPDMPDTSPSSFDVPLSPGQKKRPDINATPDISNNDMQLIKEVWQTQNSILEKDLGVDIFEEVFKRSEPVCYIFCSKPMAPDAEAIKGNGRLLSHTRIVKNALDDLIVGLVDFTSAEAKKGLINKLRRLGCRHSHLHPQYFSPDLCDYFLNVFRLIFAESIIDISAGWRIPFWKRKKFDRAWKKLILFLIGNMRYGYTN